MLHLDYSPITGPKGNIEFLLVLQKPSGGALAAADLSLEETVEETVADAHATHRNV